MRNFGDALSERGDVWVKGNVKGKRAGRPLYTGIASRPHIRVVPIFAHAKSDLSG